MKHISKYKGDYEVSHSITIQNGKQFWDDINLIWRYDLESPILVNWYYGDYNEETTDNYIKDYLEAQEMEKNQLLQNQLNETLGIYLYQNGCTDEDITPIQLLKLDKLIGNINDLMNEIIEQNKSKTKIIDLPICYVDLIADCLRIIKRHNLYSLIYGEEEVESAKGYLDEVLDGFCKPLNKYGDDVEIIIKD